MRMPEASAVGGGAVTDASRARTGCLGLPLSMFFEPDGRDGFPTRPKDDAWATDAVRICRACPVRGACLGAALEAGDIEWGVLGGVVPRDRRALLAEHRADGVPI